MKSVCTFMVAVIFSVCFGQVIPQNLESDQADIKTKNRTNSISVSPELYSGILEFLLKSSTKNKLKLETYLYHKMPASDEVDAFLSAYYSGFSGKTTASGKTTMGNCTCKTITPTFVKKQSPDRHFPTSWPGEWREEKQDGKRHWKRYWEHSNGPAKSAYLNVFGKNGAWDQSVDLKSKYVEFEFLNLCTEYGAAVDCACNKIIKYDAMYYYDYLLQGSSETVIGNHGRWANVQDGLAVAIFDRTISNGVFTVPTIQVPKFRTAEAVYAVHVGFNWGALIDLASSVAGVVLGNLKGEGSSTGSINGSSVDLTDKNSITNALKNFEVKVSSQNPGSNNDVSVPIFGDLQLKANIPKKIYFISECKLAAGGYGHAYSATARFENSFHVDFHIPLHSASYDGDNNLISLDDCCNESLGTWYIADDYAGIGVADMKNNIKTNLNAHNISNWEFTSQEKDANGFFTDAARITMPNIDDILTSQGSVETGRNCGCEAMKDPANANRLLTPRIYSVDDKYCDEPLLLEDINFPTSLVPNMITTVWKFNGSTIAGSQNMPNIHITQPGIYTIEYEDTHSPFCATLAFKDITDCDGNSNGSGIGGGGTGSGGGGGDEPGGRISHNDGNGVTLSFYPNPVLQGKLNYSFTNLIESENDHYVVISSLNGQVVYEASVNNNNGTLDLSELDNGMYLLILMKHDEIIAKHKIEVLQY